MVSLKFKEILCVIYSGLLFISGVLLITFSVLLSYKIFYHYTFIPSGTIGPFIVIFLLGISHLFLTWLGVKGPTREHDFHVILFMICTVILLIAEFTVGIWLMVHWNDVSLDSVDLMTKSFKEMLVKQQKSGEVSGAWGRLQSGLKCCGLQNAKDYTVTPLSCFINDKKDFMYEEGCRKPLDKYVKNVLVKGALIGFLSGIFQVLGVAVFAIYFKSLRADRQERIAKRLSAQREPSAQAQTIGQSARPSSGANQTPVTPAPPTSSAPTTPPVTTA